MQSMTTSALDLITAARHRTAAEVLRLARSAVDHTLVVSTTSSLPQTWKRGRHFENDGVGPLALKHQLMVATRRRLSTPSLRHGGSLSGIPRPAAVSAGGIRLAQAQASPFCLACRVAMDSVWYHKYSVLCIRVPVGMYCVRVLDEILVVDQQCRFPCEPATPA